MLETSLHSSRIWVENQEDFTIMVLVRMGSSLGTFGAWPERDQIEAGKPSPSVWLTAEHPRG